MTPDAGLRLSATPEELSAVENRHILTDEDILARIKQVGGSGKIRMTVRKELVAEVRRRFKRRPRKPHADGSAYLINGCCTFKEWVKKHLGITDRQVRNWLDGRKKQGAKAKRNKSSVLRRKSVPQIIEWLDNQASDRQPVKLRLLCSHLEVALARYQRAAEERRA